MKASDIRPGSFAITRVSGARKRVTILGWSLDNDAVVVRVQDTQNLVYRTPRQLTAVPVNQERADLCAKLGYPYDCCCSTGELASEALRVTSGSPGQTIDAGDVVITTTLQRLG